MGMSQDEVEAILGSADNCGKTMGTMACTWGNEDSKHVKIVFRTKLKQFWVQLTTAEKQWVPWHVHGAMKTVSTLKSYLWVIKPLPSLTMD